MSKNKAAKRSATKSKHVINIVVGDWSDDGHGKTYTHTVSCNKTPKELQKAYERGVKKLGYDLGDYCKDYEDSSADMEFMEALQKAGMDVGVELEALNTTDSIDEADSVYLSAEDFAEIWMFIASLGAPSMEWEVASNEDIRIGGYGCFS